MSETSTRRRIRAQSSVNDENVVGFILDKPVQNGRSARLASSGNAPLARALYALSGVDRVEVADATIWVRKTASADWTILKPAIAEAIRHVLDETDTPLGPDQGDGEADADAVLFDAVTELLERQINPAVASHGGRISAERVEHRIVYLRMSGGCQGCAASSATLRQGVERMLLAALPQIEKIVDVTDHGAGTDPYYQRSDGASPILNRVVPAGTITLENGQVTVDPDYLAPRLGLTPEALREGMRRGDIVGVTETGEGHDAGKSRIVLRSPTRAWAAEIGADGVAREIPPPRLAEAAGGAEQDLTNRVRAFLAGLSREQVPVTYGALARGLGYWMPGAIGKVTRALETTMREDAAADRPFIAARVVSRGHQSLPGKGFFDLARDLSRGPQHGESDAVFHAGECARVDEMLANDRKGGDAR